MGKIKLLNTLRNITLSLMLGICFLLTATVFSFKEEKAFAANVTSSSVLTQSGYAMGQITSSQAISVGSNSVFTVQFNTSFVPQTSNPTYTLSLNDNNAFPAGTQFILRDYTSNVKTYMFTTSSQQSVIYLEDFAYGQTSFQTNYTAGLAVNECLQITVNLSNTSLNTGSYTLTLSRQDGNTTSLSANFTIVSEQTTFSISAQKTNETVYTDSTERVSLTITPSNSTDNTVSQKGRGIRVSFVGDVSLPETTKFELYQGDTKIGDDWAQEKSFAFSTTTQSTVYLDLTIPSSVIADGDYSLLIELYTEDGGTLAQTTITFPVLNVNYKTKLTNMVNNGQGFSKNLVYYIDLSTAIAFDVEESLPDDATVTYFVEKRNMSDGFDIQGSSTSQSIAEFRNSCSNQNGLNCGFVYQEELSVEGVYRFCLQVYDRNGDLQSTSYCYFVVAEATEGVVQSI